MQTKNLTHGGDWAGFETEYGHAPLDFSMNVNPLGMAPEVIEAIAKAGLTADRYPDPLCRALTARLAEHEGVEPAQIFCGNGAADIIFRLAQALKPGQTPPLDHPVLHITAPTFSEYETAFTANGWVVRRHTLKEEAGFQLGEDFPDQITEETGAVFLCEPNNPTGVTTEGLLLEELLKRCEETGTYLVIDECFNGFLENPQGHSMRSRLDSPNLIILKAFTKIHGMAGVRLGYCLCGDAGIPERLRAAGAPWNVSSLAQAAGIAALSEKGLEHARKGRAIIDKERPWLIGQLHAMGIGRTWGEANYILFHSAPRLDAKLRKRGILIRNCDNYPGLGEGWFRIAVRNHEENERLIRAMREASGLHPDEK